MLQNYAVLGAVIFFAFGLLSFLTVYFGVLRRPQADTNAVQRSEHDQRGKILWMMALIDLVGFPVVGYYIGPSILPTLLG